MKICVHNNSLSIFNLISTCKTIPWCLFENLYIIDFLLKCLSNWEIEWPSRRTMWIYLSVKNNYSGRIIIISHKFTSAWLNSTGSCFKIQGHVKVIWMSKLLHLSFIFIIYEVTRMVRLRRKWSIFAFTITNFCHVSDLEEQSIWHFGQRLENSPSANRI